MKSGENLGLSQGQTWGRPKLGMSSGVLQEGLQGAEKVREIQSHILGLEQNSQNLWLSLNNSKILLVALKKLKSGPKETMTATDVTGFDAIFSTGFFAAFSRF